ncbi:hypothetical protein [Elioraea sp.]|uniref:hypothetical protein n=1 Tax=Elioraea sp. TaxID=2185103 RepID=UPI0021DEDA29|nr:hypothetical protein [Elioraea sp.]GIX12027.1 MAG: hypothetical protein KatS3mg116_3737 [Elioraea sp.]
MRRADARVRDPERWRLAWWADQARVQHAQWLMAARRGGACGIHAAECLARAAEARRRLAGALAALRTHDAARGRVRRRRAA